MGGKGYLGTDSRSRFHGRRKVLCSFEGPPYLSPLLVTHGQGATESAFRQGDNRKE